MNPHSFLITILFPTLVSALLIALTVFPAHAVTITYEATDLTDTTPGEDLWQYTYWLADKCHNIDNSTKCHNIDNTVL